jgi:alpha-glucosidase
MQYPSDSATHAIDTQFFYGPALLISPVTEADSTSVSFYLPNDIFYDLFTMKRVQGTGASVTYSNVQFTDIPVHVRGGSIIPARVNSANTTTALRKEDFELLVAPDKDGNASGSLYLDDGESLVQAGTSEIQFTWDGTTINLDGTFGFKTSVGVRSLTIMGDNGATKYDLDEKLDGSWSHTVGSLKQVGMM